MQAITFLKEIEQLQSPVLSFNDVIRIIGKSKEYSRVYIHRLKQKNIITEIEKGKYALSEEPFEIASNLVFPSYISFMGAYYIYGFTTQIPIIAQIVCQNPKKEPKSYCRRAVKQDKVKARQRTGKSRSC